MANAHGCEDLEVEISATIAGLSCSGKIQLRPPANNRLEATVTMTTTGSPKLDVRADEAFKPLLLSSMRISDKEWDASSVHVGGKGYSIPASGWLVHPAVKTTQLAIKGGTSSWKKNAPTMEITLAQPLSVTGWVTSRMNPNEDNVGLWPASPKILSSWSYTIVARP